MTPSSTVEEQASINSPDYADLASPAPPPPATSRRDRHNPKVGIMHHAGLHHRLREHRGDRVRQAGEAVTAGDQDVAQPAIAQLREDRVPELRTLGLGDPAAERVLAALDVDPDDQVRALDRDRALVPDLDADTVDIDDRINLLSSNGGCEPFDRSRSYATLRIQQIIPGSEEKVLRADSIRSAWG
jgi:hypothetical protein